MSMKPTSQKWHFVTTDQLDDEYFKAAIDYGVKYVVCVKRVDGVYEGLLYTTRQRGELSMNLWFPLLELTMVNDWVADMRYLNRQGSIKEFGERPRVRAPRGKDGIRRMVDAVLVRAYPPVKTVEDKDGFLTVSDK